MSKIQVFQEFPKMTARWEILFGQKSPLPWSLLLRRPFSLFPSSHLSCCSAGNKQQHLVWRAVRMPGPPLPVLGPLHFSGRVTAELPGAPVNKSAVRQWPHSPQTLCIHCRGPELCNARIQLPGRMKAVLNGRRKHLSEASSFIRFSA